MLVKFWCGNNIVIINRSCNSWHDFCMRLVLQNALICVRCYWKFPVGPVSLVFPLPVGWESVDTPPGSPFLLCGDGMSIDVFPFLIALLFCSYWTLVSINRNRRGKLSLFKKKINVAQKRTQRKGTCANSASCSLKRRVDPYPATAISVNSGIYILKGKEL